MVAGNGLTVTAFSLIGCGLSEARGDEGAMKARLFVAALALVALAAGTYFYFWP